MCAQSVTRQTKGVRVWLHVSVYVFVCKCVFLFVLASWVPESIKVHYAESKQSLLSVWSMHCLPQLDMLCLLENQLQRKNKNQIAYYFTSFVTVEGVTSYIPHNPLEATQNKYILARRRPRRRQRQRRQVVWVMKLCFPMISLLTKFALNTSNNNNNNNIVWHNSQSVLK